MKQAERPVLHRWTRHEYERLIDHGFLDEDDPIELLDGLLLVKEPQHSPHRTAVLLVAKALERAFGDGWFVQTQSPIILDDRSEPEPDVAVIRGSPRDYVDIHPTHPALIVEIAQSGLRSEEHTSELQSRGHLVCRLLLEKKKKKTNKQTNQKNKKICTIVTHTT